MRVLMRVAAGVLILLLIAAVGFFALAWKGEIEPVAAVDRAQFDQELIEQGARLAAVGNCIACHTVPGQPAFAGGLALPTPFGTIYSTNITPDPETGIGKWSEEAFQRAMREGVDREGNHLYPAFPYDHYTRVTDEDNRALYAFLMTRQPVNSTAPENELPFPYNMRMILAGWKLLFFEEGAYHPDTAQSEEWNRGAYLAEGLGHCGACHSPRNRFGAIDPERHFGGGEAEGWQAYAINTESPAPIPWDQESLAFYLRQGWHEHHGVSRGPMAEVTGNLGLLPDSDIAAIATYVASVMGEPDAERQARAEALLAEVSQSQSPALVDAAPAAAAQPGSAQGDGAAIYAGACAGCHDGSRPQPFGGLPFSLSTAVNAPNPQNIVNVVLYGLPPADGEATSVMPAFGGVLNDEQVADLLAYMRERFSDAPAWENLVELVARTRSGEHKVAIRPSDGIERGPENVGASGGAED
ncbi:cytochrome c [Chelativorans sp.]|uniref:c-type cytochrome n=1 Tax=Chelativorans sp. TaxID=2203393 RepID=UPI002810A1F0|nr:cytochrome c [Chelativorans sp.]